MAKKRYTLISVVLIAIFSQFFIVRAFHTHKTETEKCCHYHSDEEPARENVSTSHFCEVCHLLVTPFIKTTTPVTRFTATLINVVFETRERKPFSCKPLNLYLRAPPVKFRYI